MIVDLGLGRQVPDRCPFPRPFEAGFDNCPGFQRVRFTALDSRDETLGTWFTCRHLTSGQHLQEAGHFYPRCSLGAADDRLRWVASVSSARLEVARALQEEFDRVTGPYWRDLIGTKRRALAHPSDQELKATLEQQLSRLSGLVRGLFFQHRLQLDSVGLQIDALVKIVEATARQWARSSELAIKTPNPLLLQALLPEFQAFIAEPVLTPWQRPEQDSTRVYEDPVLRIFGSELGLCFLGTIDASNSEAVSAALAAHIGSGGEYHLDFGGLVFCDVGALRTVVELAERLRGSGELHLDNIPSHLARIVALAGWAGDPGLVMVPTEAVPA